MYSRMALLIVATLMSCTHPSEPELKVISEAPKKKTVPVLPPEQCLSFANDQIVIPFHIEPSVSAAVITRLTKPCITRDGKRGYEAGTAWMAMGIPCSGGRGTIEITGRSYNPKMLSFHLSTNCSMNPSTTDELRNIVEKKVGLGHQHALLAYNPLAVQYWEVPSSSDADASERIDIRGSDENLRILWNDFKEGKRKIAVNIYGRENAWVEDDQVFKVEGELSFQAPHHFNLSVQSIRSLSRDEVKQVSERCTNAKIRKNCADIF